MTQRHSSLVSKKDNSSSQTNPKTNPKPIKVLSYRKAFPENGTFIETLQKRVLRLKAINKWINHMQIRLYPSLQFSLRSIILLVKQGSLSTYCLGYPWLHRKLGKYSPGGWLWNSINSIAIPIYLTFTWSQLSHSWCGPEKLHYCSGDSTRSLCSNFQCQTFGW